MVSSGTALQSHLTVLTCHAERSEASLPQGSQLFGRGRTLPQSDIIMDFVKTLFDLGLAIVFSRSLFYTFSIYIVPLTLYLNFNP